jgi:hypothetical protein
MFVTEQCPVDTQKVLVHDLRLEADDDSTVLFEQQIGLPVIYARHHSSHNFSRVILQDLNPWGTLSPTGTVKPISMDH